MATIVSPVYNISIANEFSNYYASTNIKLKFISNSTFQWQDFEAS